MAAFQGQLEGRELQGGRSEQSELMRQYRGYVQGALGQKRITQKFFPTGFKSPPATDPLAGDVPTSGGGTPLRWAVPTLGVVNGTTANRGSELASLQSKGLFDPSKHDPPGSAISQISESSEVLYWLLMSGPTFGADPVGSDVFSAEEVRDTDGDGLLEFVDAWERPLRFYRWPTRLIRPGPPSAPTSQASGTDAYFPFGPATGGQFSAGNESPPNPAPAVALITSLPTYSTSGDGTTDPTAKLTSQLGQDRDDPFGEALAAFVSEAPPGTFADAAAAARAFEMAYHTPNTWHSPLIVSAGPDGDFGLYAPSDGWYGRLAQPMANATGDAYAESIQDNITNLNSQASGTGGR